MNLPFARPDKLRRGGGAVRPSRASLFISVTNNAGDVYPPVERAGLAETREAVATC